MSAIFITGTGTRIGKTVIAAILTEALQADYWKPVQAGYAEGTDSEWISKNINSPNCLVHPEVYKFKLAASPHIAAREEKIRIDIKKINKQFPTNNRNLIIEGAGGLLVPLNEDEFVIDLIKVLPVKVVLVSRNYLGSINHSLLTARVCKDQNLPVVGWIFNDQYMNYEEDIVKWTGYRRIASVPFTENPDGAFVAKQAAAIREQLATYLC